MTTKFTQPCFIRKNTPKLRDRLEELGYKFSFSVRMGYGIGIITINENVVSNNGHDIGDAIDCGENEELFLALAALREDSDINQYFTNGNGWYKHLSDLSDDFLVRLKLNGFDKATPEELIEHFKK